MTRIVVDNSTDHTKPHSICFYHYIKDNKINTRQTFFSKTFTNSLDMQKQYEKMFGKQVVTRTRVGKSTDYDKPHFGLFFTTISMSKKMFFFRARAEKGIA